MICLTMQDMTPCVIDMQSLGVLLYLMCFGRFPFEAGPNQPLDRAILSGQYKMPPSKHSSGTRHLVAAMLTTSPAQRPDIDGVLTAVRRVLYPGGVPTSAPKVMHTEPTKSASAQKASAAPPVPAPAPHRRSISAQGAVQASASPSKAASKPEGAQDAAPSKPARPQTAAVARSGAGGKDSAVPPAARPRSAAPGADALSAVAATQRPQPAAMRSTKSSVGSLLDGAPSQTGEQRSTDPSPHAADPFASHATTGSAASAEQDEAVLDGTARAMSGINLFAPAAETQSTPHLLDPFQAPAQIRTGAIQPFESGPTLNPPTGAAAPAPSAAHASSRMPIAVPASAPDQRTDNGGADQALLATEVPGSAVLQPQSNTNPFSPPQSPHAAAAAQMLPDSHAASHEYTSQADYASQAQAQQSAHRVRSRFAQLRRERKGSAGAAQTLQAAPAAPVAVDQAASAPAASGGSPSARRHRAGWFSTSSGGGAVSTAATDTPAAGVAAYISSALTAEDEAAEPVEPVDAALPTVQLRGRPRTAVQGGAAGIEKAAPAAVRVPQSKGAATADPHTGAAALLAAHKRGSANGHTDQLDLQTALAAMTAERDDLKLRLALSESELERHRSRVAEMRSVIEALSNTSAVEGVSSAAVASALMPDEGVANSPVVATYVTEAADDEDGDASPFAASSVPERFTGTTAARRLQLAQRAGQDARSKPIG